MRLMFQFQETFEEIKLYGIILSCFIGNSIKLLVILLGPPNGTIQEGNVLVALF